MPLEYSKESCPLCVRSRKKLPGLAPELKWGNGQRFEGPLPKDFYPKGDLFLIIDNQSTTIFQMKNPITYHFQNVFCFFELTEGKGRSHLPRRDFKSHGCNGNESSMLYRVLC